MKTLYSFVILFFVLSLQIKAQVLPTWQRAYNDPAGFGGECSGLDGCRLTNGNFIITAITTPKQIPVEPMSSCIFVLNPYGDIIDSIHYYYYSATRVLATLDNGCIIMGRTDTTQDDMCAMKLDSLGRQKWVKHYDNTPTIVCLGATRTSDNNFFAVGQLYYDYSYIIKIDSNGNRLWQRYYAKGPGRNWYITVCDVGDGTCLAGGNYETSTGGVQGYVTHFDEDGNILSEKEYKYEGSSLLITKINKLNPNSYLLTGKAMGTIALMKTDSSGNIISTALLPSIPGYSVVTYDCEVLSEEKYVMVNQKYNTIPPELYSLVQLVDSSGNILNTVSYGAEIADVDLRIVHKLPGNQFLFIGISNTRNETFSDVFVVRADSNLYAPPCGIRDTSVILPGKYLLLTTYPNPFNSSVNIRFTIPDKAEYTLGIYNILGQRVKDVFKKTLTRGEYIRQVNLSSFSSGMYFVRLSSEKFNITKKIVLAK